MELPLAPFFLKQLLRRGSDVNDLASLDAELYRNLMFLREYEGDVEDLAVSFTASRQVYGANSEVRILPWTNLVLLRTCKPPLLTDQRGAPFFLMCFRSFPV